MSRSSISTRLRRIAAGDAPAPYNAPFEQQSMPTADAVAMEVRRPLYG